MTARTCNISTITEKNKGSLPLCSNHFRATRGPWTIHCEAFCPTALEREWSGVSVNYQSPSLEVNVQLKLSSSDKLSLNLERPHLNQVFLI